MASTDDSLEPDAWGVHVAWEDARHKVCPVPDETIAALHEVIGPLPPDLDERRPLVTRPGRDPGLGRVEVCCEDGRSRIVDGTLPADFPLGYHTVRPSQGHERPLIVSPGRCWLPEGWRAWGWAVQVYSTRSRDSWGVGDLGDLKAVREWSQSQGAGFLLINPLHAVAPTLPQETSPYLPATRRFLNPIYLRVADVPGADRTDLSEFDAQARELNDEELIDRDAVWQLKRDALWRVFGSRRPSPGFDRWRAGRGRVLQDFATWCALGEVHGPDWREWPTALRDPGGEPVSRFADENSERVTFFAWLQWLLGTQLREATGDLTVIQDLPIGVDGGGFDAWSWQDQLAEAVMVGAPPDIFNAAGQAWGSPPFIPWRLEEAGYRPFIESIRDTMAGAGGLRIDHVMGLFRLWWIPEGASPAEGAYVRYPSEDLLDIVALESHRARAIVVGEDLGTVEPGVREALADHAMLSYRLLWFEDDDPSTWPVQSMAAVTTHDLPTVAGLWSGADVAEQQRYSDGPSPEELSRGRDELLARLKPPPDVPDDAPAARAVQAAYRRLAAAPSTLISATLEDAVADARRPNLPGVTSRPNWCLPLPVDVDGLARHPVARAVAEALRKGVRPDGEVRGEEEGPGA